MTKRAVASLLGLALALGLAGCSLIGRLAEVENIVAAEGVETRAINIANTNGVSTLSVAYATEQMSPDGREEELERITRALWQRAPFGFDYLDISAIAETGQTAGNNETLNRSFPRSELEDRFGPRPEGLEEDIEWLPVPAAVLLLVLVLLVLAVVVVVILLVRRSRRRLAGPPSGWGQGVFPYDRGPFPYPPAPAGAPDPSQAIPPGTGAAGPHAETPGASDPWRRPSGS